MNKILFILLLAIVAPAAMAQKEVTVEGRYRYVMEDNETQAQAQAKAIDQARFEALREKFGTYITGTGMSSVVDGKSKYVQVGMNEVKGEWIRDLETPKVTREIDPSTGQIIFTVVVRFKARERLNEAVEVEAKLLRNGTTLKFADTEFNSGDQMYLWFKAPCDGFLTVYIEGEGDTVYRLLPYNRSRNKSYPIKGNKEYVFFSQNHIYGNETKRLVDEQLMTASSVMEWNRICVIFSPNEYTISPDSDGSTVSGKKEGINLNKAERNRELPKKNFQEWLGKCRTRDPKMNYLPIDIITKRAKQ